MCERGADHVFCLVSGRAAALRGELLRPDNNSARQLPSLRKATDSNQTLQFPGCPDGEVGALSFHKTRETEHLERRLPKLSSGINHESEVSDPEREPAE